MLDRGYLLPNADFQEPKPELTIEKWKMRVSNLWNSLRPDFDILQIPQRFEPFPRLQRASVNSFGYGGVNAHAILRCAPSQTPSRACVDQTLDSEAGVDGVKSLQNGRSRNANPKATHRVHDLVHDSDLEFFAHASMTMSSSKSKNYQ